MDTCLHCGEPSGSGRFCGNCGIARSPDAAPTAPFAAAPGFWHPLPVGMAVQGRYTVQRLISRGSFGAVYEAEDGRFSGQRRALKELVPVVLTTAEFDEAKTWFLREAEMLGDLNHPAIPRVWDSFEEHGRLYIVMQYIDGCSLEDVLAAQAGGGIPVEQVLSWARALCAVLEYLHGRTPPVLFRDLKPANIMLDGDGRLVLIDFGIATRFAPQRIGTTIGTPGYAPPEQYQGLAEPRSDLYALAATLHHLLTGRDPAHEAPFSFPPLDPSALGIQPTFARAISDALSFVIDQRPASVEEFQAALSPRAVHRPSRPTTVARQVVRSDLRHASVVANQPWSAMQREFAEAKIPQSVETLLGRGSRQKGTGALDDATVLRVQALRQEADRLGSMGHYAKAVATLDQALALQQDDEDLWRAKGRLLRQAGRPADAIIAFRESLRLDPDEQLILSSMGWCLAHIGEHQEALAVLEKAIVLDPLDAEAWSAKGWSLACQKRLHEALRALDEATQLDPGNAEAWRTRGYCLERLGREGEALRAFQRAQRAG